MSRSLAYTVKHIRKGLTLFNKLHRFTYDDYVCIARNREIDAHHGVGSDAFVWDPTEPIATRPLMCNPSTETPFFYCHDGNKNVSEVVMLDGTIAAHYDYSSFGKVVLVTSENEDQSIAYRNPYRFSSEYADDEMAMVYFNYRYYEPIMGRWMSRDKILEHGGNNIFAFIGNQPLEDVDQIGNIGQAVIAAILFAAIEGIIGNACAERAERLMPAGKTDAFDHCFVSCETSRCMALFNGPALASGATFLGGILHEIWQKLEDPSHHSLEGALADIKSNLIGLVNALKPGDCEKNCECENQKSNP